MVGKIARQLKTFACHAPRGLGCLGAHKGRLDHAIMDCPFKFHQE